MTTQRPEIILSGSDDGVHWKEYQFKWQPGDLCRRPGFCTPFMPRLDWQMWFVLALGAEIAIETALPNGFDADVLERLIRRSFTARRRWSGCWRTIRSPNTHPGSPGPSCINIDSPRSPRETRHWRLVAAPASLKTRSSNSAWGGDCSQHHDHTR